MVKFKETDVRLFRNVFVCRRCKAKIRATPIKVKQKKVRCRKCGCKRLRPKRKETKK